MWHHLVAKFCTNAKISNKFMWRHLLTKFASYKVPPVMVSTHGCSLCLWQCLFHLHFSKRVNEFFLNFSLWLSKTPSRWTLQVVILSQPHRIVHQWYQVDETYFVIIYFAWRCRCRFCLVDIHVLANPLIGILSQPAILINTTILQYWFSTSAEKFVFRCASIS